MQVADPKPQPGLEIVRELRRLVALLGRRRHELDLLDEAPVPLRDAGLMVVLGEDALRSALQTRLSEASALLAADEDREDVDVQMEGLRKILEAPEWDTAALAVPALRDKRKQQEAIIQGLQDEADVCRQRIEPLRDAINSALEARAPVRTQLAALMRMEALVGQADRALGDKRYADVSEPLAQLRAATGDVHALIPAIEEKAANARRFNRQADVLLIRSPSEGRHMYTVLLRTPSEPGSHGINIQDSSCLVDEDREYVRDIIERVTRAVDAGTVRRFRDAPGSDDRATNGSQSTPDVTREWPVEPAAGATEPEDLAALIRDVGRVMFRLFMPDRMREYLGSTPCSITVTTNDLELPWELMQEGKLSSGAPVEAGESDGFLCLERPVARMPMGRAFPRTRLV